LLICKSLYYDARPVKHQITTDSSSRVIFKTSNLGFCILNALVQLLQRGRQINRTVKRESQITLVDINFLPEIILTDFH